MMSQGYQSIAMELDSQLEIETTPQTPHQTSPTLEDKWKWKTIIVRMIIRIIPIVMMGVVITIMTTIIFQQQQPYKQKLHINICDVMCSGTIVGVLQKSGLFINDTKALVDRPMKMDPDEVWSDFWTLNTIDKATLEQFVDEHFEREGSDVVPWTPDDFVQNPQFLSDIRDAVMRKFATDVHALWRVLGRKIADDVYEHPQRHTLMPLKNPHMIVPGGRFREFYYWDSYWIVRGLIVSGMLDTARMVTENLLGMVEDLGHVPNGARVYYANRSQPPFLTQMVKEVYHATLNQTFLTNAVPILRQEYAWWMQEGAHALTLTHPDENHEKVYTLNRYYTNVKYPRPESYLADQTTAEWLLINKQRNILPPQVICDDNPLDAAACATHSLMQDRDVQQLMSELAASAETGWDFSSRWFDDHKNLTTAETMDLIPADLNAIMYRNEATLAELELLLNHSSSSDKYHRRAMERLAAIHRFLWNSDSQQWQDWNWRKQKRSKSSESVISNFIPLWAKSYDPSFVNETAVAYALLESGLVLPGGLVTSLNDDGQQFDWPNSWPQLEHMILEGLMTPHTNLQQSQNYMSNAAWTASNSASDIIPSFCSQLGESLATQWLYSVFTSYNKTGFMFEKYLATEFGGGSGAGGEYRAQTGFGWTNGAALSLLHRLGAQLNYTEWLQYAKHMEAIIWKIG